MKVVSFVFLDDNQSESSTIRRNKWKPPDTIRRLHQVSSSNSLTDSLLRVEAKLLQIANVFHVSLSLCVFAHHRWLIGLYLKHSVLHSRTAQMLLNSIFISTIWSTFGGWHVHLEARRRSWGQFSPETHLLSPTSSWSPEKRTLVWSDCDWLGEKKQKV